MFLLGTIPIYPALWETAPVMIPASGAEGPRGDDDLGLDKALGIIWVMVVAMCYSGYGRRLRI